MAEEKRGHPDKMTEEKHGHPDKITEEKRGQLYFFLFQRLETRRKWPSWAWRTHRCWVGKSLPLWLKCLKNTAYTHARTAV
jgi:hypothetical protein